jgi:hypothetical protein
LEALEANSTSQRAKALGHRQPDPRVQAPQAVEKLEAVFIDE